MERNFAKDSIFQFNVTSDAEYAKEAHQGWPAALEELGQLKSRNEHLFDGRLQIRSYEAKDGSGKRWVTEVIASTVQFLDRKTAGGNEQQSHVEPSPMDGFGSPAAFDDMEQIPF